MVSIRVRTVLIVAFAIASGMPLLTFWAWPHSAALQAEMKSANDRHLLLALNAAEDLQDYHANVAETVRAIAPLLSGAAWQVFVCGIDAPRGLTAAQLAARAPEFAKATQCVDIAAGMRAAAEAARPGDRIVVCGSFLAVAPALERLGLY